MVKREKIILSGVVLVVVLLVAVIIVLLMRPGSQENIISGSGNKYQADANVITSRLSDEEREAMNKAAQEEADRKRVSLEYQRTLRFKDGTSTGTGYIGNPTTNRYPMFLTVEVEGTEVIRTGLIPLGGHLEKFDLTSPLEMGTYEGYLKYHGVNEETQEIETESVPVVVDVVIDN